MEEKKETVAIVGASPLKDRYSNQAQIMLEEYGHSPIPVAPKHETIEGKTVYHALADIPHVITSYSIHYTKLYEFLNVFYYLVVRCWL